MTQPWTQPQFPQAFESEYDFVSDAIDAQSQITQPAQQQPASGYSLNITTPSYPQMVPGGFAPNTVRDTPDGQTRRDGLDPSFSRPTRAFPTMASASQGTYPTHSVPFNPDLSYYDSGPAPPSFATNGSSYGPSLRQTSVQPSTGAAVADGGNPFMTSPDLMQPSFAGMQGERLTRSHPPYPEMTGDDFNDTMTPRSQLVKRHKPDGDNEDDELTNERNAGDQAAQRKSQGACQRCKGLKVKCEFPRDFDSCRRCLNGAHECVIPGRKKRRTPPKREHLINQIREQSDKISALMAELELRNNQYFLGDDAASDADGSSEAKPDVKEWLQNARGSINALSGYIASASIPKNLVHRKSPLDQDSSDDESEYGVQVEEIEDDVAEDQEGVDDRGGSQRRSMSKERIGRSKSRESASSRATGYKKEERMAILPPSTVPFGLIANLALKTRGRYPSNASESENVVGLVGDNFFRASPEPHLEPARSIRAREVPPILQRSIITIDEADKLFDIYFKYMNLSVSLIDPVLHTSKSTALRSPLLFTVVCAVASRYYTERPGLHRQLIQYAQHAAGIALHTGPKSVEMVQAYLLLSLYPVPTRRWDEDRRWVYLGLAIRIATDMNLHQPVDAQPISPAHERELLNRTRVWLNCFNLDRSTSSEYGKASTISNSDYVSNHSEDWWQKSSLNMKHFDIHICAYNAELRVMAKFKEKISDPESPNGMKKDFDFEKLASETDDELKQLAKVWFERIEATDMSDPQNCFRTGLLRLAYSYARLIVLSYGFNLVFGKNPTDENPFLQRCVRAASDVVNTVINDVGRPSQRIFLRHGPEAQSVFMTFASAFLVNLCQPKFASYLSMETRLEMRGLVQKVVDLLGSPEVAIDDRHGPKLYSGYLKGLLSSPMARVGAPSPPKQPHLSLRQQRQHHPTRAQSLGAHVSPVQGYEFPAKASPPIQDAPSPTSSTSLSPPPNDVPTFDQFPAPASGVNSFTGFGFGSDQIYQMSQCQCLRMQIMQGTSGWAEVEPAEFDWSNPQFNSDAVMKDADLYLHGYNL